MVKKDKRKKQTDSAKHHKKLRENSIKVLNRIKKKRWIVDFLFTRDCGRFDSHGIDLIIYFSPDGNGNRGSACLQEKTNKVRRLNEHKKKYPCIPAYLLYVTDTQKEIEYTYLLMLLKCRCFNKGRDQKIKKRLLSLEQQIGGEQEFRVVCGVGFNE